MSITAKRKVDDEDFDDIDVYEVNREVNHISKQVETDEKNCLLIRFTVHLKNINIFIINFSFGSGRHLSFNN
jgi:hypothetical protein